MTTMFFEPGDAASAQLSLSPWLKRLKRLHVPLETWSRRRRCVVALLIAALVFGLGARTWIVADFGGVEASRSALAASHQRVEQARRALARLPALRDALAAAAQAEPDAGAARLVRGGSSSAPSSSADDVRLVSALAVQTGVALLAVEPGAAGGEGVATMRALKLTARTDFVHLMAFVHGLADLPVLMVPVDVTVKQDAAALAVSATLQVFGALRPTSADAAAHAFDEASLDADDDEDIVFFDPFSKPQLRAAGELPDGAVLRLVGVLRDRTRGLALLDTPDGMTTVEAGQQIGAERVTSLDALGISLASGGTTRTLALAEAS